MAFEAFAELFNEGGLRRVLSVLGLDEATQVGLSGEEPRIDLLSEPRIAPSPVPTEQDVLTPPENGKFMGRVSPGHRLPPAPEGFHYEHRSALRGGPDYVYIVPGITGVDGNWVVDPQTYESRWVPNKK